MCLYSILTYKFQYKLSGQLVRAVNSRLLHQSKSWVALYGNTCVGIHMIMSLWQWNAPRGTLWCHFQVTCCHHFCSIGLSVLSRIKYKFIHMKLLHVLHRQLDFIALHCVLYSLYLHFPLSHDKESNTSTEHHYHHCSTHGGHNCDDSVVLTRGGNGSLCGCTVLRVMCVIEAVVKVEVWDCQSTWTWFY